MKKKSHIIRLHSHDGSHMFELDYHTIERVLCDAGDTLVLYHSDKFLDCYYVKESIEEVNGLIEKCKDKNYVLEK